MPTRLTAHHATLWLALATSAQTTSALANTDDTAPIEEVFITGTHLPVASKATSQLTIDSQALLRSGHTRTEDFLNDLPQVTALQTSMGSNGATGTSVVSLRDLGAERTLVLQNGRRLPYGSPLVGGIGADINQIPAGLIDNIHIVTGGLSSVYGSDAIAGVINIELKDNFEGFELSTHYGAYRHNNNNATWNQRLSDAGYNTVNGTTWDGETQASSLLLGHNFFDNKANITAYLGHSKIAGVKHSERSFSACDYDTYFDTCSGSWVIPDVRIENFRSPDPADHFAFVIEGDEFIDDDGRLYNYADSMYFQRPDTQWNAALLGHIDIRDDITLYGEFSSTHHRSVSQLAPSGNFWYTGSIACDHPYLSDQQFQRLCGDFGLTQNDVQAADMAVRNVAGGPRKERLEHNSQRYVFGSRGTLAGLINYDIAFQHARVSLDTYLENDMSVTRLTRALDATTDTQGNVVCRSALNGQDNDCIPWNVFSEGHVTQAQTDYLRQNVDAEGYTEQTVSTAFFDLNTGDLGWHLPMAKQGIFLGLGFEDRHDKLAYQVDPSIDPFDIAGNFLADPVRGSIRSREVFIETHIPLIEAQPYADDLSLEASWRQAESNRDFDTESYGLGLSWAVNDSVTFNTAYQHAVRAPNVQELFEPAFLNLASLGPDPCAGPVDADGLTALGFNFDDCARTGVTAEQFGFIPDSFDGLVQVIHGGNAALQPETANSYTAGLIITPSIVKGLTVTVDYFDIEVEDAISQLSPSVSIYGCLLEHNETLCQSIQRDPQYGDLWFGGTIDATRQNSALETRTGFDAALTYQRTIANMQLTINNQYSRIQSAQFQAMAGWNTTECAGIWGDTCSTALPNVKNNLRVSLSDQHGRELSLQWRHIGAIKAFDPSLGYDLSSVNYIDIHGALSLTSSLHMNVGINNVFDTDAPIAGSFADPTNMGAGNTFPGLYDVLGQYIYSGLNLTF